MAVTKDRRASYIRSKTDVERIEKALKKIQCKKGYQVINYRYLLEKTMTTFTPMKKLQIF